MINSHKNAFGDIYCHMRPSRHRITRQLKLRRAACRIEVERAANSDQKLSTNLVAGRISLHYIEAFVGIVSGNHLKGNSSFYVAIHHGPLERKIRCWRTWIPVDLKHDPKSVDGDRIIYIFFQLSPIDRRYFSEMIKSLWK